MFKLIQRWTEKKNPMCTWQFSDEPFLCGCSAMTLLPTCTHVDTCTWAFSDELSEPQTFTWQHCQIHRWTFCPGTTIARERTIQRWTFSSEVILSSWQFSDELFSQIMNELLISGNRTSLFCCVLFCWCVRLYFSFGYVRSQNSSETMPSRKVFCEMKDGFLIGIDTNEGGTYDSASNQGTVEYIFRVILRFL